MLSIIALLLSLSTLTSALYGPNSDVVSVATEKDFNKEVFKHKGVVVVEFFAPWCGHCKSLVPEYEKAAKQLKGIVKVVAVDATAAEALAQKFQIQGFPTIKIFKEKGAPIDYNGQRRADEIVSEAMKITNQLVKERVSGKGSSSTQKKEKKPKTDGEKKPKAKKSNSDVVELTDGNFQELVLDSPDHWMVEFFAPWCGHCKNLAPHWEKAATQLKGNNIKVGAVDATEYPALAQKYKVTGYPTIKLFPAGLKETPPQDYKGERVTDAIVEYAIRTYDSLGVPITISQLESQKLFSSKCETGTSKLCSILFLPHILDTGAAGRTQYLDTLKEIATEFRKFPITFLWSEGGAQPALENTFGINFNYPLLSIFSAEKKIFLTPKVSWSFKNMKDFISGMISGSERPFPLAAIPSIVTVEPWDGKDATIAVDEIPLDQFDEYLEFADQLIKIKGLIIGKYSHNNHSLFQICEILQKSFLENEDPCMTYLELKANFLLTGEFSISTLADDLIDETLEIEDEAVVRTDEMNGNSFHGDIHIILHPVYQIPYPYWRYWDRHGELINMDTMLSILSEIGFPKKDQFNNHQIALDGQPKPVIDMHPILDTPFITFHLCDLNEKVNMIGTDLNLISSSNRESKKMVYSLVWLSIVGPMIGLTISPQTFVIAYNQLVPNS